MCIYLLVSDCCPDFTGPAMLPLYASDEHPLCLHYQLPQQHTENIHISLPRDLHEISPLVHIQSGVSGPQETCTLNLSKYCRLVGPALVAQTHFMA